MENNLTKYPSEKEHGQQRLADAVEASKEEIMMEKVIRRMLCLAAKRLIMPVLAVGTVFAPVGAVACTRAVYL